MANTFRVVTFAAEPNAAGTPYTIYTVLGSTTTVVIGLILTNIHKQKVIKILSFDIICLSEEII